MVLFINLLAFLCLGRTGSFLLLQKRPSAILGGRMSRCQTRIFTKPALLMAKRTVSFKQIAIEIFIMAKMAIMIMI